MINITDSFQLVKSSEKGVTSSTPVGGAGNTPLEHSNTPELVRVDIWKRILSKEFADLSWEAKNSCPIGGISVNLDYFQCTGLVTPQLGGNKKIEDLHDFIEGYLDVPLVLSKKLASDPRRTYPYTYRTTNGVVFAYGHFIDGIRYTLSFPGIPLRMLKIIRWQSLISGLLADYFCNFTRCDICTDDYKRRITGRKLIDITQRGDVARILKYFFIESGVVGNPGDVTCYWGGGRKQLYFYNAQSLHGTHCDRYEARFREDRAHIILSAIADFKTPLDHSASIDDLTEEQIHQGVVTQEEVLQDMLQYMGSTCLGTVDFLYRNGRKGRSHKEFARYDFWLDLIDDVGLHQHIPVPVTQLDTIQFVAKTVKWLATSVFKRLAILYTAIGSGSFSDYLNQEINLGALKFDDYDLAWIAKIKGLLCSNSADNVTSLDIINFLKVV